MRNGIAARTLPFALGFSYTMFIISGVLAYQNLYWAWCWPNYWVGLSLLSLSMTCFNALLLGIHYSQKPRQMVLPSTEPELALGFSIIQGEQTLCDLVVEFQPQGLAISNINGYSYGTILRNNLKMRIE